MEKRIAVTIQNGRGESISVTINVRYRSAGKPGAPERHRYVLELVETADDIVFSDASRAMRGDGSVITAGIGSGRAIEITRGTISRIATYPVILVKCDDKTKRGRFLLRDIDLSGLPGFE